MYFYVFLKLFFQPDILNLVWPPFGWPANPILILILFATFLDVLLFTQLDILNLFWPPFGCPAYVPILFTTFFINQTYCQYY